MQLGRTAVQPQKTTAEVISAAAEIVALLKKAAEEGKESSISAPSSVAAASAASDRTAKSSGNPRPAPSQPSDNSQAVGTGSRSTVEPNLPFAGDRVDEMAGSLNLGEIVDQLMGTSQGRSPGSKAIRPLSSLKPASRVDVEKVHVRKYDPRVQYGSALRAQTKQVVGGLSRRMDAILEARAQDAVYISRSGNKLHTPSLFRTALGNSAIFLKVTEGVAVNTAVSIIFDQSSSMNRETVNGTKYSVLAAVAAMALVNVLERNGAAAQLSGFGGFGLQVYKDWSSTAQRQVDPLPARAIGGTPLAGALSALIPDLMLRQEDRKICFIVTDGEPNSPFEVHAQLAECLRAGLEPRFVLISDQPEHIRQVFLGKVILSLPIPFTAVAASSGLAEAIFGALAQTLYSKPRTIHLVRGFS
jgi:hypothetical protein